MVLGAQANKDSIRIGAEKAVIRASFQADAAINLLLDEMALPVDDSLLVISREINAKGKSLSRINGQIVTLNQLKSVTDQLLSIHGQNEHQNLLEREQQMLLLDAFGGSEVLQTKHMVTLHYVQLSKLKSELEQLLEKRDARSKQMDFLDFQIQEIEQVKLKLDEDKLLEKSFEYLSNLSYIKETLDMASNWMKGDYGDGALGALSKINGQFRKVEGFNVQLDQLSDRMKELFFNMEDLSGELAHTLDNMEMDSEKFAQIEQRLDEINHLKSKYGKSIEQILVYLDEIRAERATYEVIDEHIQQLKKELEIANKAYQQDALILTKLRKEAGVKFEKALESELKDLNMKTTTFKIQIDNSNTPHAHGVDLVEFLISTNIGQPFRPLKKVVSGGELSRIMLGIKVVLGQLDDVPTLVFDEVDAGISGITANIVGEKLAKLAKSCQILCITHLPQIAVYADHHFLIDKTNDTQSTETTLRKISGKDVQGEISRLVGGVSVTASTAQHAQEMLENAHKLKNTF
jgi:DNA repair protein RecN (Recombination protein N)